MKENRNIDFDSDIETESLKDAVWRLTTRVYLLEDFIAERFGVVLGPRGYKKTNSEPKTSSPSETNILPTKISSNDDANLTNSMASASSHPETKRRKRSSVASNLEVDPMERLIPNVQKISKIDTFQPDVEEDPLIDPLMIISPLNFEDSENELDLMPKNEVLLDQDSCPSDEEYDFVNKETECDETTTDLTDKDPGFQISFKSGRTDKPPDQNLMKFVQTIRRQQQIMKVKLDSLAKIMPTLLEKVEKPVDTTIKSADFSLPIETVPDFWHQNNFFLTNQAEKEKLILMLGAIGGNNGNQTTYRVMAALMTDDLMFQFTAKGRTGKENFSSSIFLSCVCAAVRRNPKSLKMTDKEIEDRVDYWLRKAGTRLRKTGNFS